MQITDPQGQCLTPEDLALFDTHPNLMRLTIKACRVESDSAIPYALKRRVYQVWAEEMLDPDTLRWRALAARNRTDRNRTNQIEGEKLA